MYFESFQAFLQMGHHGPYVWSAYGFALVLIGTELVRAWRCQQRVQQDIRRQRRRDAMTEE